MSHDNSQIYRTTPARTGKMMIIMLGICLVGGVIFFSMWDYWISEPAPVVAMMAGDSATAGPAAHTGATMTQDLHFIESSDFRTLAFNALPGEPDNNPTIKMAVGDKVIFNVDNAGKSFHSFGVTTLDEGFGGVVAGSEVATASNPLKPGQSGTSEYIAGEEGVFYYICTVPGHREQGMVGKIIVGDVSVEEEVMEAVPEPEVMEKEMTPEPEVMEKVMAPEPVAFDGTISLPDGSGVPGCDETNECYIPYHVTVSAGEEITWSNDDSAAHTVTSGLPGAPDGIFDSSLFMAGGTFSVTLDDAGEYPYYCMVHPWMTGIITVN
ncbi:MAG: plastocyanin/azurin family copper-binding protein [Candidatus Nitrosopumilus sp. bin_7KS]